MINESSTKSLEVAEAARTNVVFFDVSDRTQIEITGADRVRFLHSFTSNDIKRLKPGQGCETFVTNLKGKVVAHVFVFCTEKSLWLDGTPGQQEAIINHLRKFVLIDDVQLIDRAGERGELYVSGPTAAALLQIEAGFALTNHVTRETDGESFDVRRVDILGQPGFLMSIPKSRIEAIKTSFRALGIIEGSCDLFENLRIEAGYPRFGVDITDDNLAQEIARTKQCVSFDKGCYLGQETIARLDALGHTNRELRRMRFETDVVPAAGTTVFDVSGTAEVGVVTSAVIEIRSSDSPSSAIALGLIKRNSCAVDTPLKTKFAGREVTGRVL